MNLSSFEDIINLLTVEDLKCICFNMNLVKSGHKAELIESIKIATKESLEKLILNADYYTISKIAEKLEISEDTDRISLQMLILKKLLPEAFKNKSEEVITYEKIKTNLEKFFDSTSKYGFQFRDSKENEVLFNRHIYEIEHELVKLKKHHKINSNLDSNYFSDNIFSSFNPNTEESDYLRTASYNLSALNYLSVYLKENQKQRNLIDITNDYFELSEIQSCLKFTDLILHKSGTTRCKVYFEKSVNDLSNMGLIKRETNSNQEYYKYLPNFFGLLVLKYIQKNEMDFSKKYIQFYHEDTKFNFIIKPMKIDSGIKYHPILLHSLLELNNHKVLIDFLNSELLFLEPDEFDYAVEIFQNYLEIIEYEISVDYSKSMNQKITKMETRDVFTKIVRNFLVVIYHNKRYLSLFQKILIAFGYTENDTLSLFNTLNKS